MSTGLLTTYLGRGLFANRPVTPDVADGALAFYYAEDTQVMYVYNVSTPAWDEMLVVDAPADADMYLRLNNAWVVLPDYPDVPDTPAPDGLIYAIKDGAWFLIPDPAVTIADLTDVDLTGLADGFILKYDLASTSWKVAAESGGGGGGAIPTIVQSAYARNGSTATATFGSATTAGNVILLIMSGARGGADPASLWQNIIYGSDGGNWVSNYQKLYACLIPCDGTAQSFTVASGDVVNLAIFEIAGGKRASGHTGQPDSSSGWKLPCMQEAVGAGLHFVLVEQDSGGPLVMSAASGLTSLHTFTGSWNHDGLLIQVDDTVFLNDWIHGTGNGGYISYLAVTVAA